MRARVSVLQAGPAQSRPPLAGVRSLSRRGQHALVFGEACLSVSP